MSLQTRLQALVAAVGADVKALQTGKADASHSHVGTVDTRNTTTTPGTTPVAGQLLFYVKSNGRIYTKDSAGVEHEFIDSSSDLILNGIDVISDGGLIAGSTLQAYDGITAAMGIQAGGDITAGGNLWSQGVTVGDPTGTRTVLNLNQLAAYTTGAASSTLYLNYSGGIVSLASQGGSVQIGMGAAVPELQFGANPRVESASGYLHMNWHNNLPCAIGSGSTTNRLGGNAWQVDGKLTVLGTEPVFSALSSSSVTAVGVTSVGILRKSSSSRRYKENIAPMTDRLDVEDLIRLQPRVFQRNDHGKLTIDEETGEQLPNPVTPETPWSAGFIAEEADELGLKPWLQYWNDRLDGFDYMTWTAAQQAILRQHHQRIADLEEENTQLKARLTAIEAHLGISQE